MHIILQSSLLTLIFLYHCYGHPQLNIGKLSNCITIIQDTAVHVNTTINNNGELLFSVLGGLTVTNEGNARTLYVNCNINLDEDNCLCQIVQLSCPPQDEIKRLCGMGIFAGCNLNCFSDWNFEATSPFF